MDWPISLPHDEIYSEACCADSWWSLWPVPITVLNYEGQRGSGTITNHTGKQIALVLFSLAVIKHPGEKKQLKEERVYFSSRFKHQSIMVGEAWHWEPWWGGLGTENHGGEGLAQGARGSWPHCFCSTEEGSDKYFC